LWYNCQLDPTTKPKEHQQLLSEWGFDIKVDYIRSIFRSWRWSWKKPSRAQLAKYQPQNIDNYVNFALWMRSVPLEKLKFLDEGK
jgi:transposase